MRQIRIVSTAVDEGRCMRPYAFPRTVPNWDSLTQLAGVARETLFHSRSNVVKANTMEMNTRASKGDRNNRAGYETLESRVSTHNCERQRSLFIPRHKQRKILYVSYSKR
jgi:hypothetical protein